MGIFAVLSAKVKRFFSKNKLSSSDRTHSVKHIHDETVSWPTDHYAEEK